VQGGRAPESNRFIAKKRFRHIKVTNSWRAERAQNIPKKLVHTWLFIKSSNQSCKNEKDENLTKTLKTLLQVPSIPPTARYSNHATQAACPWIVFVAK
jgi:hypothetical protein